MLFFATLIGCLVNSFGTPCLISFATCCFDLWILSCGCIFMFSPLFLKMGFFFKRVFVLGVFFCVFQVGGVIFLHFFRLNPYKCL